MTRSSALEIATAAAGSRKQSPEHKRFQSLLGRIDKARERLDAWQRQLPLYAQAHDARIAPLLEQFRAERRQWAFALEQIALEPRRWSRAERRTLSRMVCELSAGLLESDPQDTPDAEVQALHDRHAETDWDSGNQQQLDALKTMFETVGGIDLGDAPVESADDLMRRAQARMAEQAERAAQHPGDKPRENKRKTAAQQRAEEDQRRISQTVRDVYRKLAAALHPDRAAVDASDEQRQQRNERMARANAAYEAGDLLALLTLQLQIEHVDIAHAADIAAVQVRHFNKVLAEQLREIEDEIEGRQDMFCMHYGLLIDQRLDPNKLLPVLQDAERDIALARVKLTHERRALTGDAQQAKRWLRHVADEHRLDDEEPFFFG